MSAVGGVLDVAVQTSVLKKQLDVEVAMSQQMMQSLLQANAKTMELSVNPNVGANFDKLI